MHTSGFTHAPISKYLLLYIVTSALLVTATDTKHYFDLAPALWRSQWWRPLAAALVYTNSTEVLFASLTVYQCRVVERAWGSRKFGSFLLSTVPYTTLLPPLLLLLLRPLTFSTISTLPSGPTAPLFALLAQYHAAIPYSFRYHLGASSSTTASPNPTATANAASSGVETSKSVELTSKSTSYLPAAQLALSQLPGSLVPAAVGWAVGYAWRLEVLPWPARGWRVPLVSGLWGRGRGAGEGVQGLRMRLEREGALGEGEGLEEGSGSASGVGVGEGEGRRRGAAVVV